MRFIFGWNSECHGLWRWRSYGYSKFPPSPTRVERAKHDTPVATAIHNWPGRTGAASVDQPRGWQAYRRCLAPAAVVLRPLPFAPVRVLSTERPHPAQDFTPQSAYNRARAAPEHSIEARVPTRREVLKKLH